MQTITPNSSKEVTKHVCFELIGTTISQFNPALTDNPNELTGILFKGF